jgi:prepilin signal peptidase PulO-like enzyme (type II secretory pathway)
VGNIYLLALFVFGASIGSFLNVLGLRYSEKEGFSRAMHGRSECPKCKKKLRWYELIPILSFFVQRGRCRGCSKKISWQYPIVEILSGAVFALVPLKLGQGVPAIIWILAFLVLILISIIDLRLGIIPDKLVAFVAFLGILLLGYYQVTGEYGLVGGKVVGSSIGSYALSFWFGAPNIFINYAAGALSSLLLFGGVYAIGKGRAMGFGDVKLATAVGLLMGWPDSFMAMILAFITGAVWGMVLILRRKKGMKDTMPFGPFIVLGVTLVFFFGYHILNGYFAIFGL